MTKEAFRSFSDEQENVNARSKTLIVNDTNVFLESGSSPRTTVEIWRKLSFKVFTKYVYSKHACFHFEL